MHLKKYTYEQVVEVLRRSSNPFPIFYHRCVACDGGLWHVTVTESGAQCTCGRRRPDSSDM